MRILISQKEYFEKVLAVASQVIPAIIQNEPKTDLKKDLNRETFAFLSVAMAKVVLSEIGYTPNKGGAGTKSKVATPKKKKISEEMDDGLRKNTQELDLYDTSDDDTAELRPEVITGKKS